MKQFLVILALVSVALCCEYKCSFSKRAVADPNFRAVANGCGPKIIGVPDKWIPNSGFMTCCNSHDFCYARCNSNKVSCDNSFRTCMRNTCSNKACRDRANTFFNAVKNLGCTFYLIGQQKACKCV
ncbi:unnamed protein product [Chironomus riparius]|uniref:Uncharacterized protein n=1 Tax=Chironomus riparius TaxID=315576 RepID=A0A9N9RTX9_9DIPT|nr:unnamed protein product [Chironomus riparius]